MPDKKPKREKETPRKEKLCRTCGRPFAWTEARAKDWAVAKFCSEACSGYGKGERGAELEAAILELLSERGEGKTICPSEAARRLVKAGRIVVTQKGRVVDAEKAVGAIRLRLR